MPVKCVPEDIKEENVYDTSKQNAKKPLRAQSDMTSNRIANKPNGLGLAIKQKGLKRMSDIVSLTSNITRLTATLKNDTDKMLLQIDVDKTIIPEKSIRPTEIKSKESNLRIPKLNICIMIVGTEGDVKPFIHMGQRLVKDHGHRVRLATHEKFRDMVRSGGLEFYPLGGDPEILASYSSSNRIIPTSFHEADEKLGIMKEIIFSTFPACTKLDPKINEVMVPAVKEIEKTKFVADAIISNPPTYGHIHVATALSIPLHLFFTMPWTPTVEFCHPMASTLTGSPIENKLSYHAMNNLTWIGLRPIVNDFRKNVLHLDTIEIGENGGAMLDTNEIPFAYTWSPTLVPKPNDWDEHCDVVGFFHSKGDPNAKKPRWAKDRAKIESFLNAGEPPIFFGFGSCTLSKTTIKVNILDADTKKYPNGKEKIVHFGDAVRNITNYSSVVPEDLHLMDQESRDNVEKVRKEEANGTDFFFNLTNYIIAAIQKTGKRAIIQRGWGGLGYDKNGNKVELPDSIICIGKEAHTWLFERVAAVVHHGGAGTCAAGLLAGCPTMVASFCLDQPFWGAAIDKHRYGAPTKPVREVTDVHLIDAIDNYFYNDEIIQNCKQAAIDMGKEDGVSDGIKSFHKHLRRYFKDNKQFGIGRPQNPFLGLWQALLIGSSLIFYVIFQIIFLPFLVVAAMSEKIAEGFRFGEFVQDEKTYDEIEGIIDGLKEGFKSLWYAIRSGVMFDSERGTLATVCGIVTKPIAGVIDLFGKLIEGMLRTCRAKKGRYEGQSHFTEMKQANVKQKFDKISDTQIINELHGSTDGSKLEPIKEE